MARLTPTFSADRAVREYIEQHYLTAAAAYRERAKNKGAAARQVVDWQRELEQKWARVRFGAMKAETKDGHHVFEVQLSLGDLAPDTIQVELFADGDHATSLEMKLIRQPADTVGGHVYGANVPATRPASDYTARLIPHRKGMAVPLEVANILWQR
jgi:starch phosphorylase